MMMMMMIGLLNNLSQKQWSACCKINLSDRPEDQIVSSINCDHCYLLIWYYYYYCYYYLLVTTTAMTLAFNSHSLGGKVQKRAQTCGQHYISYLSPLPCVTLHLHTSPVASGHFSWCAARYTVLAGQSHECSEWPQVISPDVQPGTLYLLVSHMSVPSGLRSFLMMCSQVHCTCWSVTRVFHVASGHFSWCATRYTVVAGQSHGHSKWPQVISHDVQPGTLYLLVSHMGVPSGLRSSLMMCSQVHCTPCSEKKWYILFLNVTSQLQARFSYNFQWPLLSN